MDTGVLTGRTGFTSTVTTRSIASGAGARATGTGARMVPDGCIGTDPVRTSASGAVRRPTAPAVPTARRGGTRSEARERLHLHRVVCDAHSFGSEACGESQCDAGVAGRAVRDLGFEELLGERV